MASSAAGSVSIGAWPTPGTTASCHAGAALRIRSAMSAVSMSDRAPRMSRVGRPRASRRNSQPGRELGSAGLAASEAAAMAGS